MALNLQDLPSGQAIADANGLPTLAFTVYWQQIIDALEGQEGSQDQIIADLADVVADLAAAVADITAAQAAADAAAVDAAAAQTTANTANTAASTAQTTANTVKRDDKISGSFTVPAAVLTATDVGSDVTVAVLAHTRVYGDGTQVSVNSHNFTGKAFSTLYGVYYNDTSCSDTTPTYVITTNPTIAQNNYAAGRHRVGAITTPADGAAASSGGTTPTGGGGDDRDWYSTL